MLAICGVNGAAKSTIVRTSPSPGEAAEARGIRCFSADLLVDNQRMLHVLRRVAEIRQRELERGVLHVEFERRHAIAGRLA